MNDERIQQVIAIEKEAQQIQDAAVRDSEQLLMLANQEVDKIIEQAQKEARLAAQQLVAEAQAKEESTRILNEVEEKIKQAQNLSGKNFDRAVTYVLDRVIGKE